MGQELILKGLETLQAKAEEQSSSIVERRKELQREEDDFRTTIDEYNSLWLQLLCELFKVSGWTWCTVCENTFPIEEASLVLLEGVEQYSHGYGNDMYGFRDFSRPQRICPACREKVLAKHGYHGRYDKYAQGQEAFYAFPVLTASDGSFLVNKFGKEIRINEEAFKLPGMSGSLIYRLQLEFELPPKLKEANRPFDVPPRCLRETVFG